jgi:hypothetical protein
MIGLNAAKSTLVLTAEGPIAFKIAKNGAKVAFGGGVSPVAIEASVCYGGGVKWFYAVTNEPVGPVTRAELESLFETGKIPQNTMVFQEGMGYWVPYVDLKKTTQFLPAMGNGAQTDKVE